jgi:hypothetical protein
MEGRSDRLLFRLNFAEATKAALADLSDYKVSLSCHPAPKSRNPNWTLALGDRTLCERLIEDIPIGKASSLHTSSSGLMRCGWLSSGGSWTARASLPWQGQHRGEMANLATQYLLDRGVGLRTGEVRDRRVQAGSLAIPTCECRARSKLLRTLSGVVQEPSVRARLLSHQRASAEAG